MKQRQGYTYSAETYRLRYFDCFLADIKYSNHILTKNIFDDYILTFKDISKRTKIDNISSAMRFARYLSVFYPDSYVPVIPQKTPKPKKAYIYTADEIKIILLGMQSCSKNMEISQRYYTMTGVLAFTGIRIKECLNINLEHWNSSEKSLFIKNGKFGKDRLIPVTDSVAEKIDNYIGFKYNNKIFKDTPLFSSKSYRRLDRSDYADRLSSLLNLHNISNSDSVRKPGIHSFRHTFAVNTILKWKKENCNINAMLPYLVTYMGHVGITSTEVYLQSVEEIMQISADRFYNIFSRSI